MQLRPGIPPILPVRRRLTDALEGLERPLRQRLSRQHHDRSDRALVRGARPVGADRSGAGVVRDGPRGDGGAGSVRNLTPTPGLLQQIAHFMQSFAIDMQQYECYMLSIIPTVQQGR